MLINEEKKAIYIPIPKTGTKYISEILQKYYGFKEIVYEREDIVDFYKNELDLIESLEFYNTKYYSITNKGILRYFEIENDNEKTEWNDYFIFTFISNPYEKFINSFNFSKTIDLKDIKLNNDTQNKIGTISKKLPAIFNKVNDLSLNDSSLPDSEGSS